MGCWPKDVFQGQLILVDDMPDKGTKGAEEEKIQGQGQGGEGN